MARKESRQFVSVETFLLVFLGMFAAGLAGVYIPAGITAIGSAGASAAISGGNKDIEETWSDEVSRPFVRRVAPVLSTLLAVTVATMWVVVLDAGSSESVSTSPWDYLVVFFLMLLVPIAFIYLVVAPIKALGSRIFLRERHSSFTDAYAEQVAGKWMRIGLPVLSLCLAVTLVVVLAFQ